MNYIDPTLENVLKHLEKLTEDTRPEWGSMNALRMVEHLSDTVDLAMGTLGEFPLMIPEDKIEKAQGFLTSDHPMPKNFEVAFATSEMPVRNESLSDVIDEFTMKWIAFEEFYEAHPDTKTLHPSFGELNYEQWVQLHKKHLTHHFQQFGLIS